MVIILHEVVVPLQLHAPAGQLACHDSGFLGLVYTKFAKSCPESVYP